jgi:hypothetical protein
VIDDAELPQQEECRYGWGSSVEHESKYAQFLKDLFMEMNLQCSYGVEPRRGIFALAYFPMGRSIELRCEVERLFSEAQKDEQRFIVNDKLFMCGSDAVSGSSAVFYGN